VLCLVPVIYALLVCGFGLVQALHLHYTYI